MATVDYLWNNIQGDWICFRWSSWIHLHDRGTFVDNAHLCTYGIHQNEVTTSNNSYHMLDIIHAPCGFDHSKSS